MAKNEKNETLSTALILFSVVLVFMDCYWNMAPLLSQYGLTHKYIDMVLLMYSQWFSQKYTIKQLALLLTACSCMFRTGKKTEAKWSVIFFAIIAGLIIFFLRPRNPMAYGITSITGLLITTYGTALLRRKIGKQEIPDEDEGFAQTNKKMDTKYSINIPYKYIYKGKENKGWINLINPFRATIILGSPGSGKSFAVYNAFIEQTIRKGYTMFLYDYKFPDLTERVLTEIAYQRRHEKLWEKAKVLPKLYIINFDDAEKSNRCNPIHHSYITDPADTTEIADLVFRNINKGMDAKGFDFFNESAKVYLDALIWFLANYDPDAIYDTDGNIIGSTTNYQRRGIYCTFPHVIEMMACDYKKVFKILQNTKGLEAKISPFSSALEGEAMEQLQGQIASAQIPLGKFVSPALYWVMSGDDFTLDINNPAEPKIVCMGNNPDRQTIYGTTLALYTSRMFKLINHKKKEKSVVLLDELPTIFIKGLDNLIATARSNKVAIALGAQDESQLKRDYGDKESEVILTTVGNMVSGSVDRSTAKSLSSTFGKQYRRKVSVSKGEDSESTSTSYQLEDILPASRIVDMSQGEFCGWVKDNFGMFIRHKKFHGMIEVDTERNKRLEAEEQKVPKITLMLDEGLTLSKEDKDRLSLLWPSLANNEEELFKKLKAEKINAIIQENFNAIKNDVKTIVMKEYQRIIS